MKKGIKDLVGKTIDSVVVARNEQSPENQVFLVFTNGSFYELYGSSIYGASGLTLGGVDEAKEYIGNLGGKVTDLYISENVFPDGTVGDYLLGDDKRDCHTGTDFDYDELVNLKTIQKCGKYPDKIESAAVLLFAGIAFLLPMFLMVLDSLGGVFDYELLLPGADVYLIFGIVGVICGVGFYLYLKRMQKLWLSYNLDLYNSVNDNIQ